LLNSGNDEGIIGIVEKPMAHSDRKARPVLAGLPNIRTSRKMAGLPGWYATENQFAIMFGERFNA